MGLRVHLNGVGEALRLRRRAAGVSPGTAPELRALLARAARAALSAEGVENAELSITLLDDPGITDLNARFLGHDRPTDVISFALHGEGERVLGDVYIGAEQAGRQADALGVPFPVELARLVVHGTLHVLGHDHPEGAERTGSAMWTLQEDILSGVLDA